MPAQDIRQGGKRGGGSIKQSLEMMVVGALERRTRCEPPPITRKQLVNLTYDRKGDQHLFLQFAKKFKRQVAHVSTIEVWWKLDWKLQFDGAQFPVRTCGPTALSDHAGGKYAEFLHRHREPEAYDALNAWLEAHQKILLESACGKWVFRRAMERCETSVDVDKIWPGLLKLDRSGRFEPHTGRERPSQIAVDPEFETWIPQVHHWVSEGLLASKEPVAHLFKTMGLVEMKFNIDEASVMTSVQNRCKELGLPMKKSRGYGRDD